MVKVCVRKQAFAFPFEDAKSWSKVCGLKAWRVTTVWAFTGAESVKATIYALRNILKRVRSNWGELCGRLATCVSDQVVLNAS